MDWVAFFLYLRRTEKINVRLPSGAEMSYDFLSFGTLEAKNEMRRNP